MRKILLILQCFAIFGLGVLKYVPTLKNHNTPLIRSLAARVSDLSFYIACLFASYLFCYSVWPKCLGPRREKKKFARNLLERINSEIFHKDLEKHRITLFKEICWLHAIIRNYYYLLYHLILYRPKWKFYVSLPTRGRYLIVYLRCGLQFEKSSTMFRIELNEAKKCTGVAGYIRYRRVAVKIENLPDITDVDIANLRRIGSLDDENTIDKVKSYMDKGFISNFNDLKKIHRRARHFYGTIIEKKGQPWGVLLVDSTSEASPFTGTIKKRLDSFALTIGNIIDLEV